MDVKENFEIDENQLDGETLRMKISSISFDAEISCSITILGWTFEISNLIVEDVGFEFLFNKVDLTGSRWRMGSLSRVFYIPEKVSLTINDKTLSSGLIPSPR